MKLLKLSVELNSGTFKTSIMETFGLIPMEEIAKTDEHVSAALPTLDYDDEDYFECEGYAEITFKINWAENQGYEWSLVDSCYNALI